MTNPMAPAEVEAVVAKLTKAQREAIRTLQPDIAYSGARSTGLSGKGASPKLNSLVWKGVVEREYAGGNAVRYYRLTPLGLAVRAKLMETNDER